MADPHLLVRPAVGVPLLELHCCHAGNWLDRRVAAAPRGERVVRLPDRQRLDGTAGWPPDVRVSRPLTNFRFRFQDRPSPGPLRAERRALWRHYVPPLQQVTDHRKFSSLSVPVLPYHGGPGPAFSVGPTWRNVRCWSSITPSCLHFLRPMTTCQVRFATC